MVPYPPTDDRPVLMPDKKFTVVVALLLALHFGLAVTATFNKSATYDEPLHLTAGYSYWRYNDFRLQPENGNLPQRWAALPLLLQKVTLPADGAEERWATSDAPRLRNLFLYESGNDTAFMLATARTAAAVWSVALGLLIVGWSRRLWGDLAGLFSLSLFVFSATTLAHGPLVTSDMSVSFFLLAAVGAYWRHLKEGSAASLALSVVTTGLCAVAKFSFVLLPFVFGLMALWRLVDPAPWEWRWRGRHAIAQTARRKLAWLAGSTALHLFVAWLVIWTFFGWRYLPGGPELPTPTQYYVPWSYLLPPDGLLRSLIDLARAGQVLPEAFLQGFTYVYAAAQQRAAFLNGEFSITGWWWFFPYAFLIKTPVAELVAVVVAAALVVTRWARVSASVRVGAVRADIERVLPLAALFLVYGLFSVTSSLNIGHRHLLPLYPVLFILAGAVVAAQAARWRRGLAAALVVVAIVESVAIRPHYLAYFNFTVGGPSEGWRHLVDSSLDWGQDLPGLAQWLKQNRRPAEPVYVSVFGHTKLAEQGIEASLLSPDADSEVRPWIELEAGIYGISATMLQNVYSPWAGPWSPQSESNYQVVSRELRAQLARGAIVPVIDPAAGRGVNFKTLDQLRFARLVTYLRVREPEAVIGYSVFVFRLNAEEIRVLVSGTAAEFVALIEQAQGARRS